MVSATMDEVDQQACEIRSSTVLSLMITPEPVKLRRSGRLEIREAFEQGLVDGGNELRHAPPDQALYSRYSSLMLKGDEFSRGAPNSFLYSACHYDFPRAYTFTTSTAS